MYDKLHYIVKRMFELHVSVMLFLYGRIEYNCHAISILYNYEESVLIIVFWFSGL